ncbi:cytochrome P450 2U1-like [Branchiostoma floridae]|uniref:Cytochrome P450 2U1-like n=1 Tax=Branchiostoma floridae TaxID=7739 RepID=A0A9J7MZF9_BRAFL|nr:cytochrome P450 2U1-like [Branchiostoma floridae]
MFSALWPEISIQTIALFFVVFLTLHVFFKRRKNLPPSPSGSWPVVGHLLSLGRAPHLKLTEWRKQYGDVYTVRMGMEDVVVLNGYRAIKEALVDYKDAFSNRPDVYLLNLISGFGKDIAISKFNQAYKEKRKFAYSALRNLGMRMGPGSMEENIREEARQLCMKLSEQGDAHPRDIADNLTVSVANIICSMVFGKRYDYDDEKFLELSKIVNKVAAQVGSSQLMAVFPFLRFIPGVNSTNRILVECIEETHAFLREEITQHRETMDNENPRDFIDLLLNELQKTDCFTEENIDWIIQDLFFAGIETTVTSLRWGLLFMVLCPEEQQKVQAELDSILRTDHDVPTLAHRSQLPYTEATIMEIQRIRAILPLGVPRAPNEDTTFRGYDIPAGTQVLPNLWSAHMDPEYWSDPEKFDPRRFLDSDGKVATRPESYMPFSTGRRVCLGEQLAKMELFLIFSSLLKHFTFKLPEGAAAPSTDGCMTITLVPPTINMTMLAALLSEVSIRTIAVFLVVSFTLLVFFKRRKNLPPSPSGSWPVVGHLLSLGRAPHLKLTEWRKQYGDVYTVRMGMEDVVVLNGYRAIKEALVDYKDAFSSRPNVYMLNLVSGFGKGIGLTKFDHVYKEKRKFAYSALRNLGMRMGPGSMEENIREEARQLCLKMSEQGDAQARDIADNLTVSVANIICSMVFGKRYDYDDVKFVELTKIVNKLHAQLKSSQLMTVFPFLRFIPGVNSTNRILFEYLNEVHTFIRQEITKHRETLDNKNPRDFIDLLLNELQTQEHTDCFTEENIVWIVQGLFLAGVETTANSLRWGLLYMVLCPEEQHKVQAELDSVLGADHDVPTLAHRSQLPYTEATIMEIQRIRAILPLNLPHATNEDTTFRGYDIPAGTQVLPNLWSANMDPEFWPDPEKFDPRRFLDSDGKVVTRQESFLPFSAGEF